MPSKIYFLSPVDCGSFIQGERCLWRKKKNQIKKKDCWGRKWGSDLDYDSSTLCCLDCDMFKFGCSEP